VEGQLSAGHGRALLAVKDPTRLMALAREAATGGLSVREVERRVRESGSRGSKPDSTSKAQPAAKRELRNLEDQLRKHFQTDVTVATEGSDRGEIRLRFYSSEDLERLFELLLRPGSGFGD
jgi:ParB family transcriptional regulator, chromosome partitioning protein